MTQANLDYLDSLDPGAAQSQGGAAAAVPHVQVIDAGGQTLQRVPLTPAGLMVGRQASSGIMLDDPTIGRNHLRVNWENGQVVVTDLGSRSGTTLDGEPLQAHIPQQWVWWQRLAVGPYQLVLEQPATGQGQPSAPTTTNSRISVQLAPPTLVLTPGLPTIVNVTISNQGTLADEIFVSVEGVPPEWVSVPPQAVQLGANRQALVSLTVIAPMSAASRAQEYPVTVVANSKFGPSDSGSAEGRWSVRPFVGGAVALQPKRRRGRRGAFYTVVVTNQGNDKTTYQLAFDSENQTLEHDLAQRQVTVEPGQIARVRLGVEARDRLVGDAEDVHRFTVRATAPDGQLWQDEGEFVQQVPLPAWIIPLAALLLLLLLVGSGIWLARVLAQPDTATRTAIPTRTLGPGTPSATPDIGAIADARIAERDRQASATALAALSLDDDGDGLSNLTEGEIGTDENKPDTDGDGFTDRDEVRTLLSNPLDANDPARAAPELPPTATPAPSATPAPTAAPAPVVNSGGSSGGSGSGSESGGGGNGSESGGESGGESGSGSGGESGSGSGSGGSSDSNTPTATPSPTTEVSQPNPGVSISDRSMSEGNSGLSEMRFTVKLSAASTKSVRVDYNVSSISTSNDDYDARDGSLTFDPGQTSKTITIPIRGDTLDEEDEETFAVRLVNPENAVLDQDEAIGTIRDDDEPPAISVVGGNGREGPGATVPFTLTLSGPSGKAIAVGYTVVNGSAIAGRDFSNPGTTTAVFSPGSTNPAFISVPVIDNQTIDGVRSFTLSLTSGSVNVTIQNGQATGTILDNDAAPVIPPPTTKPDAYATDKNQKLSRSRAQGVLQNDLPANNGTLTAQLATNPANGTLDLNSDGSFEYTPNANFVGSDSFQYRAVENGRESELTTVTIQVNDVPGPTALPDSYQTVKGVKLVRNKTQGVLRNDTPARNGTLTARLVNDPTNGTLVFNDDGSFEYTPNTNFTGSDSFEYQAIESGRTSAATIVTIQVSEPTRPLASPDEYRGSNGVLEDGTLTVSSGNGLLTNDTPASGGTLQAIKVQDPQRGQLTLNSNGSFTYKPDADYFGTDTFTYKAREGSVDSADTTVTIDIRPVNDAPSFTPGSSLSLQPVAGPQQVPWASNISVGPTNEVAQTLTFEITLSGNTNIFVNGSGPQISATTGNLAFTLSGVTGSATVTVVLKDNGGTANGGKDSAAAVQFTISVQANLAPEIKLGNKITFTENSINERRLATTAVLSDTSPSYQGGMLTVSLTPSGIPTDTLSIVAGNSISVSGNNVLYNGTTVIGTFAGGQNGTDLIISFTSAQASPAVVQLLMRQIAFSNNADSFVSNTFYPSVVYNRTAKFTLQEADATSGSANKAIEIIGLNDSPVVSLAITSPITLPTAVLSNTNGILISDLLQLIEDADPGQIDLTDADDIALKGIALTDESSSRGVWQFSTTAIQNWAGINSGPGGNVGPTSARLLAVNPQTYIRFSRGNSGNTNIQQLTFVLWDQTTGTNGQRGNTTAAGPAGSERAYSIRTIEIRIDAP